MNAEQIFVSAKNKIVENKTKILGTIAVVSTTVAVLSQVGLRQHDKFLRANDLYDEYYNGTDSE